MNDRTPDQRMYAAVTSGDAELVKRIVEEHPAVLPVSAGASSWLHLAAGKGQIKVMEALLDAGIGINHLRFSGPALDAAIGDGQIDAAKFLISRGADVNLGRMLIGAINAANLPWSDELDRAAVAFDLVKLLVEAGADVNRWWRFGDPEKGPIFNALSWAISNGREDIAEYLRAHGAAMPPKEPPREPEGIEQEVVEYFSKHFGPVHPLAIREIVPSGPPLAVHVVPTSKERNHITLFTTGMALKPMPAPPEFKDYTYAELFIQLPANPRYANLTDLTLEWPVHMLRMLGQLPQLNGIWMPPVTVIGDDKAEPIAPGLKFTAVLVMAERSFASKNGHSVHLYRVTPLYPEERDLERSQGVDELIRAFDKHSVPFIVDPQRRNVAKG